MGKKNQRLYTILGAAVGTGLAVYGIRQGIRWNQRRQERQRYGTYQLESSWPAERRYQPIDQPDFEPIPATGPLPAAPAMTGMTTAEQVGSDMTSNYDDRGTAFTTSESTGTHESASGERMDIIMDDYAAPLIEHAIAFNSVMNLLRSRQRDGEGYEGTESLTTGDRTSMRTVLDQMQEQRTEVAESILRKNKLAMRSHKLTHKLREALDNDSYTGSDLYRIYGEVQKELCSLTRELEKSGQVTITGLDQIRQLYECD